MKMSSPEVVVKPEASSSVTKDESASAEEESHAAFAVDLAEVSDLPHTGCDAFAASPPSPVDSDCHRTIPSSTPMAIGHASPRASRRFVG